MMAGGADVGVADTSIARATPSAMTRTSCAPPRRSFGRARDASFRINLLPIRSRSDQDVSCSTPPPLLSLLPRTPLSRPAPASEGTSTDALSLPQEPQAAPSVPAAASCPRLVVTSMTPTFRGDRPRAAGSRRACSGKGTPSSPCGRPADVDVMHAPPRLPVDAADPAAPHRAVSDGAPHVLRSTLPRCASLSLWLPPLSSRVSPRPPAFARPQSIRSSRRPATARIMVCARGRRRREFSTGVAARAARAGAAADCHSPSAKHPRWHGAGRRVRAARAPRPLGRGRICIGDAHADEGPVRCRMRGVRPSSSR
jgi:hypothetical protein